jgi:chromosome segregation ATPase
MPKDLGSRDGEEIEIVCVRADLMTEVWEEKAKSDSENIEDKIHTKEKSDRNALHESTESEKRICNRCGRVFKNERTLRAHGRQCQKKGNEEEEQDMVDKTEDHPDEEDNDSLKNQMLSDIKRLKEERRKLAEEKSTFRTELRAELERLKEQKLRAEMNQADDSTYTQKDSFEEKNRIHSKDTNKGKKTKGIMVLDADEENEEDAGIDDMEEELEVIEPSVAKIDERISSIDLEELTIQLENIESEMTTKVDFAALTKMSEDYGVSIKTMEDSISALNKKIKDVIADIEERGRRFGTIQSIAREITKLDERTIEILEEIGFGESLNVTKIPPNILENVYESTIEGIVAEIRKNFGSHDTESIIRKTLEDVRTRTSGSELFYFDGRTLRTRKLAQAISAKLISAKQVQTTYDEILRKLLEYVPGFKARNFRAMIKLKSQEYAVDKTTLSLEKLNRIRDDIDNLKTIFGTVSNRQNSIEIEINSLIGSKAGKEEIDELKSSVEEIKEKQNEIDAILKNINESLEAQAEALSTEREDFIKRLTELGKMISPQKKKTISVRPKKETKKEKKVIEEKTKTEAKIKGVTVLDDEEASEDESQDDVKKVEDETMDLDETPQDMEARILSAIPHDGFTSSRIQKEILPDNSEGEVEKLLQSMIDKGLMSTTKRGRHTIYIKKKK